MDISIVGTIIVLVLAWRTIRWLMSTDTSDTERRTHHGMW